MDSISGVGVIDKAMRVMTALEGGPRALGALVEVTGLTRATAHRLAKGLEAHGLLRRDAEGRFALGFRLVALGREAARQFSLADAARPALAALRDETGESVQLYVRDGDMRICVDALESPHGLRTIVEVGAVLPVDKGSAGRVLLGQTGPQGWVASVAEREPGVASVSAPVTVGGELVAAVSVSGPVERTGSDPGARYGAAVVGAATRIEHASR